MSSIVDKLSAKPGPHLGLKVVAAQCFRILKGKKYDLRPNHADKLREICLAAIESECSETQIQERTTLGLALGLLGDPRISMDPKPASNYVAIPSGEYRNSAGQEGLINLSSQLLIYKYPVTNSQFAKFIRAGGYARRDHWSQDGLRWLHSAGAREPAYWNMTKWNGPNQPVVGVSYWEAEAFCRWIGARLPTSQEWELAAGGPKRSTYPWGDTSWDGCCNSQEAGLSVTSAVGMFPLSRSVPFELEDMAGNVAQWTKTEPLEGSIGGPAFLVKGGGFDEPLSRCSVYFSNTLPAHERRCDVGFRPIKGDGILRQIIEDKA